MTSNLCLSTELKWAGGEKDVSSTRDDIVYDCNKDILIDNANDVMLPS